MRLFDLLFGLKGFFTYFSTKTVWLGLVLFIIQCILVVKLLICYYRMELGLYFNRILLINQNLQFILIEETNYNSKNKFIYNFLFIIFVPLFYYMFFYLFSTFFE